MKRFYIVFMIVILLMSMSIEENSLFASTTGKISGIIVDAETQEPLAGVNVILEGTTIGAASNLDGIYMILNVPPGDYVARASMMGFKTQRVENVRVRIDLNTAINFELQQTILDVAEEITIVADRLLVQKDMTSSLTSVSSEEIEALPVQEFRDVLELQAGIIRDGDDLHIRGGRSGEVSFWIDGVSTTDVFSGDMGVTVENTAIEELQVVSGTFNAEYGQAMSGIIQIITKEGGKEYSGQVKAYAGDYISNEESFKLLESYETEEDPVTGEKSLVGELENPLSKFNPTYSGEFSLSGPVPFVGDKLSFFSTARYYSEEGYLYGREMFKPSGSPGDNSLVPLEPYNKLSGQTKVTFHPSVNLKISYNLFMNTWKNDRIYHRDLTYEGSVTGHDFKYTPGGLPQQEGYGESHILSWNHILSATTFYEVRINRFYNEYKRYVYKDPFAQKVKYLVEILPEETLGLEGLILDPSIPSEAIQFENLQLAGRRFRYFVDPDSPEGYVHPDSADTPPAEPSFHKSGMDMEQYRRSTEYWVGKFDLTSQISPTNQLKAGIEYRQYELTLHSYIIQEKIGSAGPIVPFEPAIPRVGSIFRHDYERKPWELSAYVQDKIELKDIIFRLGMRFDYFNANSAIPTDPSDPNIYDPWLVKNRYKDAPPDQGNRIYTTTHENTYTKYTPEERRAVMQKDVDAKMLLSPRLGIAYPISAEGVIHFSYGHFFQIPEFQYLYDNPDFKLSQSGGYQIFGNPDLKPQKTVMYELGLQHQVSEDIGIYATLFYRDVRDWVGTSPLIDTQMEGIKYSQYENKDYENVRGITFRIEKRFSNNFSGRIDYSFQVAEGTYSNPDDAYTELEENKEPRKTLIPMAWDQNHTVNGSMVYRLSDWTISMIGRYWTGRPYTPEFTTGSIMGSATYSGLKENSARLPSQMSFDLYLNKRFHINSIRLDLFMNIYNIFDQKDDTRVYGDTGTAKYTTRINPAKIPYNANRIGTVEDYVNQPGWYTAPRQIQAGLTIGF